MSEHIFETGESDGVMSVYVTPTMGISHATGQREEIVRCRDCATFDEDDSKCMRDPDHTGRGWYARPDGFCAWGRRR